MKILEGKLVSVKMQNTAIVEVKRVKPHPLYKKLIRLSKKYKVDNTGFEKLDLGTEVRIQEVKPISKQKYFKIVEEISKNETKTKKKTSAKKEEKPKSSKSAGGKK